MKNFIFSLFLTLVSVLNLSAAQNSEGRVENVISYVSNIEILDSGRLRVYDNFTFYANGDKIKNEIVKKFYGQETQGTSQNINVVKLLLDGQPAKTKLEKGDDGSRFLRIYKDNKPFTVGAHTVYLVYEMQPEILTQESHETLSFNEIASLSKYEGLNYEYVQASIRLPEDVKASNLRCKDDLDCRIDPFPIPTIFSKLKEGQTFGIQLDVPLGTFTTSEGTSFFEKSKFYIFSALAGLICIIYTIILFAVRVKKMRKIYDPTEITSLPPSISPTLASFISAGKQISSDTILATIAYLGLKGYLKITANKDRTYTLTQLHDDYQLLAPEEASAMNDLFKDGKEFRFINSKETSLNFMLKGYKKALYKSLDNAMEKSWMYKTMIFPVVLMIAYSIYSLCFDRLSFGPVTSPIYLVSLLIGIVLIIVIPSAYIYNKTTKFTKIWALPPTVFLVVMFIIVPLISSSLEEGKSLIFISGWVYCIFSLFLYKVAIDQSCRNPHIIQKKIAVYKEYLVSKELGESSERLNCHTYETYFPYGLGLGVDKILNQSFQKHLDRNNISGYKQTWFIGGDVLNPDVRPHVLDVLSGSDE